MSFPTEAVLLLLFFYSITWYFHNDTMHRGPFGYRGRGRRTVLPSYPHHPEPMTSSKISGSDADAESTDASPSDTADQEEFYASLQDVIQVRNILRRLWSSSSSTSQRKKVALPDEVIDMILDEAEYWPSVVTSLRTTPFVIATDGDRECLRTPPLCYDPDMLEELDKRRVGRENDNDTSHILLHRGMHPCRKIVFDISSHDQGWGGERRHQGSFMGSWTWFSAYISTRRRGGYEGQGKPTTIRRNHRHNFSSSESELSESESDSDQERGGRSPSSHPRPFLPEPTKLQCNRTATIHPTNYHIVWHYKDDIHPDSDEAMRIEQETGRGRATLDGSAVREMEIGDEVSVWLRARFAQWRNHVDKMSVRVYWAA